MTQKRILSANGFSGEKTLIFGLYLLGNLKWVSRIDSLLEVDFGSLVTHFLFECPYKSLVGDSLMMNNDGHPCTDRCRCLFPSMSDAAARPGKFSWVEHLMSYTTARISV
jgi:hypothetical protein